MDPANWATALSGGSTFGYSLLSVVVLSSIMAMFLQAAAVRVGVAGKTDLARACRLHPGRSTSLCGELKSSLNLRCYTSPSPSWVLP
jgi:manganese transport protein